MSKPSAKSLESSLVVKDSATCIQNLPKVVYTQVVSYLSPKECLSLRRVCKTTHEWVAQMSFSSREISKWQEFQLRITAGRGLRTFDSAINMNLPITSFHIRNESSGLSIYDSKGCRQFQDRYGPVVKSLIIDRLFQADEELEFFEAFPNVEEFKVNMLMTSVPPKKLTRNECTSSNQTLSQLSMKSQSKQIQLPRFTANLKKLIIKELDASSCKNPSSPYNHGRQYILNLISSSTNLKFLRAPAVRKQTTFGCFQSVMRILIADVYYCTRWMEDFERAVIEKRWAELPIGISPAPSSLHLHTIDLGGFSEERYFTRSYVAFVEAYFRILQHAHETGARIKNVFTPTVQWIYNTRLNEGWPRDELQMSMAFLDSVASIINISSVLAVGNRSMPLLEQVKIMCDLRNLKRRLLSSSNDFVWPNLKSINVTVIIRPGALTDDHIEAWNKMTQLLFERHSRDSVENLKLCVQTDPYLEGKDKVARFHETIFDVSTLTQYFRYIQTLYISGWNLPNSSFANLWRGLPFLEELTIDGCKRLSDHGLLKGFSNAGGNNNTEGNKKSVFCMLLVLKKLKLVNLDKMPGITEAFFVNAVSTMHLKELWIYGQEPLPQMTRDALAALLQGGFSCYVEKFPFHTWKSQHLSECERIKFGRQFRSIL